jgi:hypothetical protein
MPKLKPSFLLPCVPFPLRHTLLHPIFVRLSPSESEGQAGPTSLARGLDAEKHNSGLFIGSTDATREGGMRRRSQIYGDAPPHRIAWPKRVRKRTRTATGHISRQLLPPHSVLLSCCLAGFWAVIYLLSRCRGVKRRSQRGEKELLNLWDSSQHEFMRWTNFAICVL